MPGRHRAPRKPITNSTTLRAPMREWLHDFRVVVTNMLSPVPAPYTVDTSATVARPDFDADR